MMKNTLKSIFIGLIGLTAINLPLQAMNPNNIEETLKTIINKNKTPKEVQEPVQNWLANNKELVKKMTNPEVCINLKNFIELKKYIQNNKLTDLSTYSYSIKINNLILRFGGPLHYRENINAHWGRPWGTAVTQEDYQKFVKEHGDSFYQNTSRFTNWFNYKNVIDDKKLDQLDTPKCYMVEIPGTSGNICDKTYCIVETALQDSVPLDQAIENITMETLGQLYTAIKEVEVWDTANPENIRMTKDKKFVCVDLEQPNSTSPAEFLNTPLWRHWHNVFCGAEGLYKNLEKAGKVELCAKLKEWAKKDLAEASKNVNMSEERLCGFFANMK